MRFGFYLPNNGPTAQPKHIDSHYPYTVGGEFSGGETGEYMEQLTILTFLAGITQRMRLVPSVMIVPYRNP